MRGERRCVVVGAGLLGLSTARTLARRKNWHVVVLEAAQSVGHARAGSTGGARIFRLGYPDPLYVEMALRSAALWRALEAETGRRLLHVCGQITLGDAGVRDAIATALRAAGAPVDELTPDESARRFPGTAAPGPVVHEPASGVLAADECLRALCGAASFDLHTRVRVTALQPHDTGVTVKTADARDLEADVVVLCAGPNSLALLGGHTPVTRLPAVAAPPSLPQVAYFAAKRDGQATSLPVFLEWGPEMFYGLPVLGNGPHAGTYKVSRHTPGPTLAHFDPASAAPLGPDDPALLATLGAAVRRLLPALHPERVAAERCVYDNTVDTDFVLGRAGRVVLGCGTSGHGFKFGPLLGELLADLVEDRSPDLDLARFALDRSPGAPART